MIPLSSRSDVCILSTQAETIQSCLVGGGEGCCVMRGVGELNYGGQRTAGIGLVLLAVAVAVAVAVPVVAVPVPVAVPAAL